LFGSTRLRHDFTAFGNEHTLTGGVSWFASRAPVDVRKGNTAQDDVGLGDVLTRADRGSLALAAFAEAAFSFGRWRVVPGLRAEMIRQYVREYVDRAVGGATSPLGGAPNGALGDRTSTEPVLLPGLGITFEAAHGLELFANASRAFKPRLFNDGITFQAGIDVAGSFQPTYATTFEGGLRGRPWSSFGYDLSAFWVDFESPIGLVGRDDGTASRTSLGRLRSRGVEVAMEYDLLAGIFGAKQRGLVAQSNASILDARFTSGPTDGSRPQYAPPYLVRAGLLYREKKWLEVGAFGTFVAKHEGSDNANPTFAIPAYEVFDLLARVRVQGFEISGGVANAFDARYFARVRPGGGGGIDPAPGRNVWVSLGGRY
jgi:Fe(3+) dicitrate transport protein